MHIYFGNIFNLFKQCHKPPPIRLIINNGTQTFKYDEAGVSPASDSLDNPQIILPLSFTVYDNLGQPIDSAIIANNKLVSIINEY